MPKRGENIYKRKDGRWEGRYVKSYDASGKIKRGYVYGKTYSEVKEKLLLAKSKNYNAIPPDNLKPVFYKDILYMWLKSKRISVKESTYVRYSHIVERHIIPEIGEYAADKLSASVIETLIESKLREGRLDKNGGLSPKTVSDMLTIIKSSVEYAEYSGFITNCNLKRIFIKKKENDIRVFSEKEQKALTSVLLDKTDLFKLGVLICLYTGIRIGELSALRWENICIEEKTLKVRMTMQRIQNKEAIDGEEKRHDPNSCKTKVVITEPKSKSSVRDIPIPDFLLELIEKLENNNQNAFFLSGDSINFIEPRTMQNHFKKYVKQSGIEHANFHALRHTFATRCIEVGFEIKSLSEILGHSSVNITLNKYVHSSFTLKAINMNKLTLVA